MEGPREYYSRRYGGYVSRSPFKTKVPINWYPCEIVERVSFEWEGDVYLDKLETIVKKDGKVTIYSKRMCRLTKEEEEEENERIRALKEEFEKKKMEEKIEYWKQIDYVLSDDDSEVSTGRSKPEEDEDPIEELDTESIGDNMS